MAQVRWKMVAWQSSRLFFFHEIDQHLFCHTFAVNVRVFEGSVALYNFPAFHEIVVYRTVEFNELDSVPRPFISKAQPRRILPKPFVKDYSLRPEKNLQREVVIRGENPLNQRPRLKYRSSAPAHGNR